MKYPLAFLLIALASGLVAGCSSNAAPAAAGPAVSATPGAPVDLAPGGKKEQVQSKVAMPLPNAK